MTKFVQVFLNGLTLGSLYALIALGYTLVYGILRFINFAHSDIVTYGAWLAFVFATAIGWAGTDSPAFAMPFILLMSMAVCAAMGFTIERLAYRPLRQAPRLNVLITAIGVSLFLQNAGQLKWVFGTQPQAMPKLLSEQALFTVANVKVPIVDVWIVVLAFVLLFLLQYLVYQTRMGQAMRAVSFDERTASLMGVNVGRVISFTFMIGSALAAAGGMLYGLRYGTLLQSADAVWVLMGLKAFVAAVVGGIGNVRGAVAGAFLIASVEMFGAAYLNPQMRDVYVFGILIAVLILRPGGLLGKATVEKV